MATIDPKQALQEIDNALAQLVASRAGHVHLQQCVQIVRAALSKLEVDEEPDRG